MHDLVDAIHAGPQTPEDTGADLRDAVTPEVAVKKQSEPQALGNAGTNQGPVEGPEVTPKKHRQRVELNVFKLNPLDQNSKGEDRAAEVGDDVAPQLPSNTDLAPE